MKKRNTAISENVGFVPAQKYYEILQELILDMLDSSKENNINGMIDAFQEIYLITLPFTQKFMNDEDTKLLDVDDIYNLIDGAKDESSDVNIKHNNRIIIKAKREINKKKKVLYERMAKARLFVPLYRDTSNLPAALAQDEM